MKLKAKIRKEREKLGLSQQELAELIGVHQYNISDFETGRIEPNVKTLIKLADAFHITIDDLLSHKKETKKKDIDKRSSNRLNQIEVDISSLSNDDKDAVLKDIENLLEKYKSKTPEE